MNSETPEAFMFKGWKLKTIAYNRKELHLTFTDPHGNYRSFRIWHHVDCCEYVRIDKIVCSGEVANLFGTPLTIAEQEYTENGPRELDNSDFFTWSHYRFGTDDACIDIWFLGESNGYYGETTVIEELDN